MSETEDNIQYKKPRTSKPAITSLVFGVLSLYTLVISEPGGWCGTGHLTYIYKLYALRLSSVIGLTMGLLAIVGIKKSSGILKGRRLAIAGIVTASVSLILGLLRLAPQSYSPSCAVKLSSLGKAMLIYTEDFNGQYPIEDNWCDLLIIYEEVSPEQLMCKDSDAKIGESSYALNKNVASKKPLEIHPDTVVLFETNYGKGSSDRKGTLGQRQCYKTLSSFGDSWDSGWLKKYKRSEKVYELRWNQVGGSEILTTDNHKGIGCNVLFNDGHVEFVKAERLGELKWDAEEKDSESIE